MGRGVHANLPLISSHLGYLKLLRASSSVCPPDSVALRFTRKISLCSLNIRHTCRAGRTEHFFQHRKQAAIKKARVLACLDEIPTFIISMRPAGLRLFGDQNEIVSFDDPEVHQSWEEYDEKLEPLLKVTSKNSKIFPELDVLET